MIVDTSAIVAIVLREPGWEEVMTRLATDTVPAIGAPTLAEVGIVLTAKMGMSFSSCTMRLTVPL